ncbi:succinylglutamate-semialdehyde dehydrogenase [uncultured Sphingomonas sp.]|uniref:succinylglutamate-semialdehyde dehydrogenase n=1 Tax=uncultured Sphingomonas sp. TaxID=158754 RepID=UPI0025CCAB2F|nr:succinylglutamate-semialdehyde dehydrogenase [uncultured Sphingomonas sp.]
MTEFLSTFEPATGALLAELPIGDAFRAVAVAREAWPDWAATPLADRIATLRRFAEIVRDRADGFADLIARETGKPLWEAKTEVDTVIAKVAISITAQEERAGTRVTDQPGGGRMALRHRPHGVLAVLGPYNFPAHLPNGHIVPALLAGNAVVFKPSEKTPASGAFLVECYLAAGVPEGVVQLLIGGPDQGRALAGHEDIDGLLFTGSARTGLALNRQFAERPEKILALEMGGNNPLIVWDDPDLDAAAALIVQSAYTTAGQRCTAGRRLIVEDRIYDPLMAALTGLVDRIVIGAPHDDPVPFMGPVIDDNAAEHLLTAVGDLVAKGAKIIRPLERLKAGLPLLTPAILDVSDVADRPDDELFGPVLQVARATDFADALRQANATRYGLSASLISPSRERYDNFWTGIRAGIVNWNRPTNGAASSAPFGGIGWSGNHRPSAYYAADYCAYPVASAEADGVAATIPIGLRG